MLNCHVQQIGAQNFGYSVPYAFADFLLSKRAPPIFKKGATIHCGGETLYFTSSNPGGREKRASDIYGNLTQISAPKKPGNADILGISAEDIYSGQTTWR